MKLNADAFPKNDLLNRKFFANQIATGIVKSVQQQSDGFVTAITGKWGSGKSTLLEFIRNDINNQCKKEEIPFISIEFNPWMFSDRDNIQSVFIKHFSNSLKPPAWWKKILIFHSSKLELIEYAHSGLGKIGKETGNLIKSYLDSDNPLVIKKKIDELLIKENKKIFVFIDDIDRLNPKQIFELLQVLKLTGNFKNTYYIIAFDREAVETAIETQFNNYGKKYLDKIIQADFLIPEASDDKVESILFTALENLCKDYEIDYPVSTLSAVWLHKGLRLYFQTLRDVYRYINSLQFSLPTIPHDIDITDFLILEAIRLNDFEAHQMIFNEFNKQIFTYGSTVNITKAKEYDNLKHNTTKKLIKFLFPENGIGSFSKSINKRLCDPKNFSRYFTLQISISDISEVEFKRFMESGENRLDILTEVLKFNRLDNLLIRLNDADLYKTYNNWDFSLVRELFIFFNWHAELFSTSRHQLADAIINLMCQKKKEQDYYFNLFLELLLSPTQEIENARIYFFHFIIQSKVIDNGFPGNAIAFKDFYLQRYDQLIYFYMQYLKNGESKFFGTKIPSPISYYTLLYIYDFANYHFDKYHVLLPDLLKNQSNLIFFLKNILVIDTAGEASRINADHLNKLLPDPRSKYKFVSSLKNMDISVLTEDQHQWRNFVLEDFKSLPENA